MGKHVLLAVLAQVLALTWGQQVEVNHPVLGQIIGRHGVTSRDQTPYWTFHGIPYADPESYTGVNRFKPSAVYRKALSDCGPFYANKVWVFCPQQEVFDLSGIIPEENIPEPGKRFSKAQDLPAIFRAIHQNKRHLSEVFRTYSSSEERTRAFQAEPVRTMGREDCLTININTPNIPADGENPAPGELLPVVVFYHGGGSDSVWGSAFTALRMLEDPVVLVTMNYRLGVLGALNLGTDDAPGNAGMYDSVTVLEWVQEYISYFGGDPQRVTISGQSAGSMIVANLVTTPLTKDRNLFHGVWGFSGSAISVWAVSEHPSLDNHLEIAAFCDCYHPEAPEDIATITKCMQEASLETLVTALALWKHEEEYAGRLGYDARMPSIQAPGLTTPYFMKEHPYDVMEKGEQRNVPMVLGATRHDGSYPLDDIYNNFLKPHGLDKNETFLRNDLFPTLLKTLGIRDDTGELYHVMARDYLGNASLTGTLEDKLPGMLDMVTVMAFKAGEFETLKFQSRLNKNSYFYSLDYVGRWSLYNFLWGDMYIPGGICHTDDLIYFFWLGPLLNTDMKVSRRWTKYLVNFAYHGDPNGPEGSKIVWEPYHPIKHPYMKLDRHDKTVYNAPDHWKGASKELFVDWSPNPDPTTDTTPDPTTPIGTGPTTIPTTPGTEPTPPPTTPGTEPTNPPTTPCTATTPSPTTPTTPGTGTTPSPTTPPTGPTPSPTTPGTGPTPSPTTPTTPGTGPTPSPTTPPTGPTPSPTTPGTGPTSPPTGSTTPDGGSGGNGPALISNIYFTILLSCGVLALSFKHF